MNTKQKVFFIYSILSTIFWFLLLVIVSLTVNTDRTLNDLIILGEKLSFMLGYGILTLLIYRTLIIFLKVKVEKLAHWHSLREKHEDYEFVRLIELFTGITAILASSFIGAIMVLVRQESGVFYSGYKEALILAFGSFVAGVIAFYLPILLEKEYMLIAGNSKPKDHK
ncbi:MAG: hypothetical protein WCK31_02135 [bacterium]